MTWNNIPFSSIPPDHIPQLVEQSDLDAVAVTVRTGG